MIETKTSTELQKKIRAQAHYDAIGFFVCDQEDGDACEREAAYDHLVSLGGLSPDHNDVSLWEPFEGFCSNVIVEYIDSEEESLFQRYMAIAEMALEDKNVE